MMRRILKCSRRAGPLPSTEEGSALVELALSMPLLLVVLLGAAEFARIAYASIEVVNAAHSAAVYAASGQATLADAGGITNAANSDAQNLIGSSGITVTSVTTACTCADTTYTPSDCNDNATCNSNNTSMVTAVTVQTQSTFSPLIRLPGGAATFNLQGQSTEVVSNQ